VTFIIIGSHFFLLLKVSHFYKHSGAVRVIMTRVKMIANDIRHV
jgi:hypothetical protein